MSNALKDNIIIKNIIKSNKLFFIGRIAGCELKVAYKMLSGNELEIADDLYELENNAGIKVIHSTSLQKYVQQLVTSYSNCTLIAEWETAGKVFAHTGIGQQLITNKTSHIQKINAKALEPYYYKDSWMPSLKGKKILIVHPFAKTFTKQITIIKKIFPNQSWFEDCNLTFIKPPVTLAGNHQNKDWEEHYNIFIEQLLQITTHYDIALVAAGGYGMLIANYIYKELGKSVIYIGGALQLFFGVIGKRWFDNNEIMKLVNDDWIRPDKEDIPRNFIKVEKGCYW